MTQLCDLPDELLLECINHLPLATRIDPSPDSEFAFFAYQLVSKRWRRLLFASHMALTCDLSVFFLPFDDEGQVVLGGNPNLVKDVQKKLDRLLKLASESDGPWATLLKKRRAWCVPLESRFSY